MSTTRLSTRWGWVVKIGFNLVHVVIECPQRTKIGSPPLFQLRVYNQIIFFDVCTALAEISTDCLTQVKALMHFFLIVIKRCHRAYTKLSPCWSVLEFWKIKLEKSSPTNWIFSLQKSISKLIFEGYTGSKNQVQNRLKIQFVELDFSQLIFQKNKYRSARGKSGLHFIFGTLCTFLSGLGKIWVYVGFFSKQIG